MSPLQSLELSRKGTAMICTHSRLTFHFPTARPNHRYSTVALGKMVEGRKVRTLPCSKHPVSFEPLTRMPSVDQVEFNADLVANALWNSNGVEDIVIVGTRIKRPSSLRSIEIQDDTNVVIQDDVDIETTCDAVEWLADEYITSNRLILTAFLSGTNHCPSWLLPSHNQNCPSSHPPEG